MSIAFGQRTMEIDAVATGRRIQEIRKQKGLRVVDISDYLGFYEPQAVYKWLRGECLPTLQNMYQLSLLFGTTIDDIIRCSETKTRSCESVTRAEKRRGDDGRSSSLSVFLQKYLKKR